MALVSRNWTVAWKCWSNPSRTGKWWASTTKKTLLSCSPLKWHFYLFLIDLDGQVLALILRLKIINWLTTFHGLGCVPHNFFASISMPWLKSRLRNLFSLAAAVHKNDLATSSLLKTLAANWIRSLRIDPDFIAVNLLGTFWLLHLGSLLPKPFQCSRNP